MSTSGGTSGGARIATAHLNTAAILATFSAPTQIIAAPGANKAIQVLAVTGQLVPVSGSFLDLGSAGLFYDSPPSAGNEASYAFNGRLFAPLPNVAGVITVGPSPVGQGLIPTANASNKAVYVAETNADPVSVGPITAKTIAAGGTGYANGDTGTIGPDPNSSDASATYLVTAVDGGGAVTAFTVTAPGALYSTSANPLPTATGGAQPGAGTDFTINVTAVTAASGDLYVTCAYNVVTLH